MHTDKTQINPKAIIGLCSTVRLSSVDAKVAMSLVISAAVEPDPRPCAIEPVN